MNSEKNHVGKDSSGTDQSSSFFDDAHSKKVPNAQQELI